VALVPSSDCGAAEVRSSLNGLGGSNHAKKRQRRSQQIRCAGGLRLDVLGNPPPRSHSFKADGGPLDRARASPHLRGIMKNRRREEGILGDSLGVLFDLGGVSYPKRGSKIRSGGESQPFSSREKEFPHNPFPTPRDRTAEGTLVKRLFKTR